MTRLSSLLNTGWDVVLSLSRIIPLAVASLSRVPQGFRRPRPCGRVTWQPVPERSSTQPPHRAQKISSTNKYITPAHLGLGAIQEEARHALKPYCTAGTRRGIWRFVLFGWHLLKGDSGIFQPKLYFLHFDDLNLYKLHFFFFWKCLQYWVCYQNQRENKRLSLH